MPTIAEPLSSRRRTEVLALMCAASAVVAAARPSLGAAAQTAEGLGDRGDAVLNVVQPAFVDGLHTR